MLLAKKRTPSKQRYYRSTIKMHESSPVAAALFIIPSLCNYTFLAVYFFSMLYIYNQEKVANLKSKQWV